MLGSFCSNIRLHYLVGGKNSSLERPEIARCICTLTKSKLSGIYVPKSNPHSLLNVVSLISQFKESQPGQ